YGQTDPSPAVFDRAPPSNSTQGAFRFSGVRHRTPKLLFLNSSFRTSLHFAPTEISWVDTNISTSAASNTSSSHGAKESAICLLRRPDQLINTFIKIVDL